MGSTTIWSPLTRGVVQDCFPFLASFQLAPLDLGPFRQCLALMQELVSTLLIYLAVVGGD